MALSILKLQTPRSGSDFVFGRYAAAFADWSRNKKRLDNAIAERNGRPLADWRLHDLRRTAATGMADIGIQPHIIEAVLNHISGHKAGVAGIYNRASYAKEKAEALARSDEHLRAIVDGSPSKVVGLRGGGDESAVDAVL